VPLIIETKISNKHDTKNAKKIPSAGFNPNKKMLRLSCCKTTPPISSEQFGRLKKWERTVLF
jgi:hypothetical protein